MDEFKDLDRAIGAFRKSIANFPVGAVSVNDLKPTEEKIQDTRNVLKALQARKLTFRAMQHEPLNLPEISAEDTFDALLGKIAHCVINDLATETSLQNDAGLDVLKSNSNGDETSENLKSKLPNLFFLNDNVIKMERRREELSEEELEMKIQVQQSLADFSDFLKRQKEIRKKKLAETNPELAQQRELIQNRLQKINITKRLITNLAAAAGDWTKDNPILLELLKENRELITAQTIQQMATENASA